MRSTITQHEATFTRYLSSQAPKAAGSGLVEGPGSPTDPLPAAASVMWGDHGTFLGEHNSCKFALGLGEAGLETSLLLSLSKIQGSSKGGESLVSLPGVLWATGTLASCPGCVLGRGEDLYQCQVELHCLLRRPGAFLPCKLFVVCSFSSLCNLYFPLSHTDLGSLHFKHWELISALAGSGPPYSCSEDLHGKAEVILQLSRPSCLCVFNF